MSVTCYLAARSRQEVRQMVAELGSHGAEAAELMKQTVPGLATAMEQAQHLLDMYAAEEEELARKKMKRASDSPPAGGDQHAKLSKVVGADGGARASPIVPCF
uniref:Uncharacterized protein n=1 Tax=Oryza brachyantha TaxID=4533 RepID=J3MCW9_ORYBR